jgi:hypothetical protein
MPVLSLSQKQCHSIQSPALCTVLPKLHLNRHTSRAIIFGLVDYGSLDLPELYTSEGISQLRFLLGHSYLQLLVGSATLFFNLPFTQYSHSTEGGWLVSIWQFLQTINFQLYISKANTPEASRLGDIALMDYFVSLRCKPKQLRILNRCRVYLQVIFLLTSQVQTGHIYCRPSQTGTEHQSTLPTLTGHTSHGHQQVLGEYGLQLYAT